MDDETSDYILEDKLQKKFVEVWNKLCQLHKQSASTSRPTQKSFQYQGKGILDLQASVSDSDAHPVGDQEAARLIW